MREVPQRLASPSEEPPLKKKKKKKKKNQISVSITLSNSILNCSTLALFTASVGSLFHIGTRNEQVKERPKVETSKTRGHTRETKKRPKENQERKNETRRDQGWRDKRMREEIPGREKPRTKEGINKAPHGGKGRMAKDSRGKGNKQDRKVEQEEKQKRGRERHPPIERTE